MAVTRKTKRVKKQKEEPVKIITEEEPKTKTAVEPVNPAPLKQAEDDTNENISDMAEEKKPRRLHKRNIVDGSLVTVRLKGDDLKLFLKRYKELNEKYLIVRGNFAKLKKDESLVADTVSVKKRGYSWVLEYKSREAAVKNMNILKTKVQHVKDMGGKLSRPYKVYAYQLTLENIPTTAKKRDLRKAFPKASLIKFSVGNSTAKLIFKKKQDAANVFRKGNVLIQDVECIPMYILKKHNIKLAKPPKKKVTKKTVSRRPRRKGPRKENVE